MSSWNVIFLIDQHPATKIVLLKRAFTKKFAPGMYTGIGGKVEEGETLLDSAYRELKEETGIENVRLNEFAKVIIDEKEALIYFWGKYQEDLPTSDDGTLEWISTNKVLSKNIIPTTLEMLKHWNSQNFSITPFEMHVKTIKEENGIKQVEVVNNLTIQQS